MLVWHGCAEPDSIGLDLVDDQAGFLTTDTLSIMTFTERDDSIPTNLSYQNLLGLMYDPVFGKIRASIVTQFRLPSNNFSLGEKPVLDSIVLSLGYSGLFYGNLETMQTIKVYELKDPVPDTDTIFSNRVVETFSQPIGQRILRPAPKDSTLIDTTYFAPHFSIRLSDDFGQKIIEANGTSYFENIVNFLDYFKGLKITVEDDFTEGGSIFNIDMFSFYTRLSLHYKLEGDTLQRPLVQNFFISDFTKRYTYVEHFDFEGCIPYLAQQLSNPGQASDSLLFLRSLGGLRAKIKLPYLEQLASLPKITINQAQLIVPVDSAYISEDFFAARNLILLQQDEDGKVVTLRDFSLGSAYFGGVYNEKLAQYEFNITQHVQEVLSKRLPNNDLILLISGSADNAQRIVLKGPGRSENPMKLRIRYSVFN